MKESWRHIVGYENLYMVSDQGRVRSLIRKIGNAHRGGKVLKPIPVGKWGHLKVGLSRAGECHYALVHRLVLEAFVGPCPHGMESCHFPDSDPSNNRLNNLRWDTPTANHLDAIKHGTLRTGTDHEWTRYDYSAIYRLHNDGCSRREIAAITGISRSHLGKVLNGCSWRKAA